MEKKLLALTLALSLLLASCGGGASAATMHLRKTEGTVGVSDGEGKGVEPREDLGLYSGYGVDTQAESYAWISLDDVKLTKLDQNSEIAIIKGDKKLGVEVKSGNLFFNVTQPLADDETMNIRTSTMLVGIRGTCGWVTQTAAALLGGTVEVTAGEQSVTITAGEMAFLTADGELEVKKLSAGDIPVFVAEELGDDEELTKQIQGQSGFGPTAEPPANQFTPIRAIHYQAGGTLDCRTDYIYNGQSNMTGSKVYLLIDGVWTYSGYNEFTLNEQGREQETRCYNEQGQLVQLITLIENTADHATYRSEMYIDGMYTAEVPPPQTEYTIYYDDQGREIRNDESSGYCIIYEYDSQGKIVRTNEYNPDGILEGYSIFEYES